MKNVFVVAAVSLFALTANAQSVKEKKARAAVDDAFAESTKKVSACGKTFKFVYDWKSFDAIDFAKIGRDKMGQYGSEVPNVAGFGEAINKLCADKDYKEALGKISTIVYKPTNDDSITVKGTVASGTLTLENYCFGSTRDAGDYEKAAADAL
ncbi:MAG: hypothetical protein INH41_23045 [Myxococcaceae bacterium]|jgi:hypothetical protein|nr:hypothetical protein [Myxococcaceae bacterium]MCA3015277.1 hypothetical protein [Myxococcaceae bacterium]